MKEVKSKGHPTLISDTDLVKDIPESEKIYSGPYTPDGIKDTDVILDKYPEGTLITDTYAKPLDVRENYVIWDNQKWKIEWHEIVWKKFRQICREAKNLAKDHEEYIELKQEFIMKERIDKIGGNLVDETYWANADWTFCESIRIAMFRDTGEFDISEEFLKNLMGRLTKLTENTKSTKDQQTQTTSQNQDLN